MTGPRVVRIARAFVLVVAGAFALAVLAVAPSDPEFGYDASAYIAAAERLQAGTPLYPEFDRTTGPGIDRGGLLDDEQGSFFYPPLVAAAFVPLSNLPDATTALMLWYGVLIAVAAAVGAALVHRATPETRAVTAAAYVTYLPLLSELRFGNVNLLTLAIVLAAWRFRDRTWIGGPLLAAGVGLKLLPLALLAFLLVAGRGRLVAAALATGGLAVAVSWPWLGTAWLDYVVTLGALGLETPAAGSNIVPAALSTSPGRYIVQAGAVLTALAAGLVARRAAVLEDQAFRTALAAAPLLVTSVWYPYLVLALPALLAPTGWSPLRHDRFVRALSWAAIQARVTPLPIVGVVALVGTRVLALFAQHRPGHATVSDVQARGEDRSPVGP